MSDREQGDWMPLKELPESEDPFLNQARTLHRSAITIDGHCDTPYRLKRRGLHIEQHDPLAQLDLRSMQEGGITASFFAAYVPPFYAGRGAFNFANQLIDLIEQEAERHRHTLDVLRRSEEIRQAKARGRIGLMIGVEGGHAIEDSLEKLHHLYDRGARYLTLTHVNTNNWADSSGDEGRHGGLTSFGREVVREMNSLGMIVDISHVADTTFYHALECSSVPIIASHSSCRALARHPRNLTDAMLKDLASAGGVCMINFFSAFIDDEAAQRLIGASSGSPRKTSLGMHEEVPDDRTNWDSFCKWFTSLDCPPGTLDQVVDHIVHVATISGIDSVGIGSDFDGVPLLPSGIENAARIPYLSARMLQRGFHEEDVKKVLGENFLRAFGAIEKGARTN